MPSSYFVCDHRQSFNGPHCGLLPPDVITPHWVQAAIPSAQHPPLASYEWYVSNGLRHMLGVREGLRQLYGLPPFAVVFCCFNQLYKLDPDTFAAWCKVLRAVPNSVLWLLRFPALAQPHIAEVAAKEHLAPHRLIFCDVAEKVG